VTFPQVLGFALFALFIQTIVSNKFVGHTIVIGLFVLMPILYSFGWENSLYLIGQTPTYTYSDMNGYGHFVPALFWSITYWFAIMAVLAVISIALARRGAEDSLPVRARQALRLAPRLAPFAIVFALIAAGAGSWYFYNAHVLNEYLDSKARRDIQADYERKFKQYENLLQPKVTAVDAAINIYPDRRSFDGNVRITLQNKTNQPIPQIHLTDQRQSVSKVRFDRPFHLVSSAPRDLYSIYALYALEKPLAPGETITLTCNVGHQTRGFRDGNEPAEFAYNGTFFDSDYVPYIGYNTNVELDDPRRRREERLPALEEMAHRGDPVHAVNNVFFRGESDWITYHTVVSTSPDQVAIAPGYLQREWQANGRRFFEYSMGSTHILDFFSYISARYQVRQETYHGPNGEVALAVYYDPAHTYDIDDMLASSRAGLDYYQRIYSPYQFSQYRIFEFPRYRNFAQSFPNTIPYSEGIGFIGRVLKPTDIDFTYFVTAHELGHQWWAHQLIGADAEGSNMMSESLAEYSALQVMAHKYGRDLMHRYLRHELDSYLRGRPAKPAMSRPSPWSSASPTSGTRKAARSSTPWPTTSAKTNSISRSTTSSCSTATPTPTIRSTPTTIPAPPRPWTIPTPILGCWLMPSAPKPRPSFSTWSMMASTESSSTTTKPSRPRRRKCSTGNISTGNIRSPLKFRLARCRPMASARKLRCRSPTTLRSASSAASLQRQERCGEASLSQEGKTHRRTQNIRDHRG